MALHLQYAINYIEGNNEKSICAFLLTIILCVFAMIIVANVGLDGNLSVVTAIAIMGSINIYLNEKSEKIA